MTLALCLLAPFRKVTCQRNDMSKRETEMVVPPVMTCRPQELHCIGRSKMYIYYLHTPCPQLQQREVFLYEKEKVGYIFYSLSMARHQTQTTEQAQTFKEKPICR